MSLTLGRQGGIAQPLKKRTVGQTNIAHIYDGDNHIKYTRDADDDIRKELSDLKAELAVTKAIRPYQDKLIQCEMEKMFTAGINYTDRKTCNVIYGVVTLPNEPTVTGLVGRNACGCLPCGFTQPASGTPAQ